MAVKAWLIDKSALTRIMRPPFGGDWNRSIQRGLVRISVATQLELGYSARSATEMECLLNEPPVSLMPVEYLTPKAEKRATEVQRLLALQGHHRAPGVPDLLIAAIAETAGLTILHADKDFDLISSVTGQPVERVSLGG
jgi:predicted nucleic acid-binding protein